MENQTSNVNEAPTTPRVPPGECSVDRIVRGFNEFSGADYTAEDLKWDVHTGDKSAIYFIAGVEYAEKMMREALQGHECSELWGPHGLIRATMQCVDALQESEHPKDKIQKYAPDSYWPEDGGCDNCGGTIVRPVPKNADPCWCWGRPVIHSANAEMSHTHKPGEKP